MINCQLIYFSVPSIHFILYVAQWGFRMFRHVKVLYTEHYIPTQSHRKT